MKDVVLVTGASGYLAGHCILRLLNDGYKVRGSLRSLKRADEVRRWLTKARGGIDPADALSFVEAELTDAKSWDATMFRFEDTGVLYFTVTLPPTAGFDNQCGYRHAQISRCLG